MGQEKNVASLLAQSVKHEDLGIKAILSPEEMQGYIFVDFFNNLHHINT